MTLDDLRVFVAVCEAGNLSAVARDLSCSQPAVSQHVKRLERETGLVLLERRPRGVVPTQAGRILYRAAAEGIAGLGTALRALDDLRRGTSGTVRISTGATTVRHFMSAGVAAFRARHPDVTLEFQTAGSSRRCLEAVQSHQADLAWVTIGRPVRGVEQRPSTSLPWALAVRVDDPLAHRGSLRPGELAGIRHIRLPEESTSGAHLAAHLAGHGIRLESTTSVADWDTALLLAELGLGHAILPSLPGWSHGPGSVVRLVPIPDLPPLTAGWAARRWDALSPLALEFADTVVASLV
ncbi:DNA-binding transcriptional regulator, LysR family [Thermomonospora echinospora]|uniref:DNA-binding transcriptional regulator, LysR family n=1 Tax=Thermomonospora echinospora TaxID=1992 RepID=A0A1H6BMF7_9ACTN|nr:LysR family transcriptional regulator [Thermomonospora echinospora]SEG61386.1 DNA-binding transcriptional regulator, LysR family [Thermomonospora echinospora]